MKSELKKSRHNIEQLINDNNKNKTLYLTKKDFKLYSTNENKKLLKTLLDSFKIKNKNVVRTFNNNYHFKYTDTIIQARKKDSIYSTLYALPDSCFRVGVKFDLLEEVFLFQDPEMNYESETVYFKERTFKNGKKIFWPLGKKRLKAKTINSCTGETTTEEIIIN